MYGSLSLWEYECMGVCMGVCVYGSVYGSMCVWEYECMGVCMGVQYVCIVMQS